MQLDLVAGNYVEVYYYHNVASITGNFAAQLTKIAATGPGSSSPGVAPGQRPGVVPSAYDAEFDTTDLSAWTAGCRPSRDATVANHHNDLASLALFISGGGVLLRVSGSTGSTGRARRRRSS